MKHYLGYDDSGSIVTSFSTDGPRQLFYIRQVVEVSEDVLRRVADQQDSAKFVDGVLWVGGVPVSDYSPVPGQVTVYQAKKALILAGHYLDAKHYIDSISGGYPEGELYEIAWNSPTWNRNSEELLLIADLLGMNSQQIDDLFRLAATL